MPLWWSKGRPLQRSDTPRAADPALAQAKENERRERGWAALPLRFKTANRSDYGT